MGEALLVDEKDWRRRADMVELVIVALLQVLSQELSSLSHFSHLSSISAAQLPSDQFYLEEICQHLLPALCDPKCK